jgi:predicted MFS family arabinose efflux permease
VLRRFLIVTALGFTGFFATLASLPWWAVRGGAADSAAGLVTTVMLGVTVAAQPLAPVLVARFGAARTLALGLLLLGAPAPLYGLTADLGPLLAISAVRGAGFALLTVVGSTLTAVLAPPGRKGETVGLYGLAIAVPNLVAVPGAVALAQQVSVWPVAALAALPVVAVPMALGLSGAGGPSAQTAPRRTRDEHLGAVRAAFTPSLVLLVVTLAGGGLFTFLPIELPTGLLATVALLLFGLAAALGRWRVGVAADSMGTRALLPASLVAAVVGLAAVAAGLFTGLAVLLLLGALVFGAGYGSVQNLTLLVAFARVGRAGAATVSAVWNAAFDAGTAVGAVLVGGLAGAGLGVAGALAVCVLLLAVALPLARQG